MRARREHKALVFWCAACAALIYLFFRVLEGGRERSAPRIGGAFPEYSCERSEQGWPVFANKIEGVRYPFFISIADLGSAERPNRNFLRVIKGKLFQKPEISETVQKILEGRNPGEGVVVDVGANVGMAAFAAAAMGFRVLAFEPVVDNLNKLCDGVYLNRAGSVVKLFHAAVSDTPGSITLHKVIGRLDNSAVSLSGAKLAFKSNRVVPFTVATLTLDSVIPDEMRVSLLKVDVQGWEYHVLKGAERLLSRPNEQAPYVVYEEDDTLLAASNSSSSQTLELLNRCGYFNCRKLGNDRHCSKLSGS
ncbi:hypothetical protein SELMODRAFT_120129 [Selaginella moellendorffii]|uniref:Methyltransferase FkbM domain-containing protein n=1 Tax=Selaginella moellendorffii TaxID=88036 RepID=D8SM27_SELML|nr:uncharacterized protein LOC9644081 [Selaginella moellendorffii]EFJ14528.1 hypothetical protein SELMODRAFT_120129 [Selaginella moellendorffii]|eukprot:XP_002984478.1 uncharacterized protein LOC9644081 [Selaginella moellendorffii]